jgi:C-terminal processing protease CtpA/Prc
LLAVAGRSVKGRYLEDVVAALADHTGPTVAMTVRRHLVDDADDLRREVEALELEAKRVALEAMLDEIERQQAAYGEVTEADRKEMQRRKQEQMERVMLEQKRQRQVKMAREAEERARRAANTPNSLMNKEIAAAWLLRNAPFEDLVIDVPKTQGELRIHVKHSKKRGLFVHGFKPNSLAQEQGKLLEGDELLAVDGIDMRGKALPALVSALRYHDQNSVNIKVRRHKYKGVEL